MAGSYFDIKYAPKDVTSWRLVANPIIINNITGLNGEEQAAEKTPEFSKPTEEIKKAEAISTKRISITFPTGSFSLDENAKYIIDNDFILLAKSFSNSRFRIEGNTDNVGNQQLNKKLSEQRAESVVSYLISEHSFDKNRFIVVGNGPDKPISDNATDKGKSKNRRTDFELIGNK